MGSGFDFSPDQIPQSGKGRRYSQVSAPLPPAPPQADLPPRILSVTENERPIQAAPGVPPQIVGLIESEVTVRFNQPVIIKEEPFMVAIPPDTESFPFQVIGHTVADSDTDPEIGVMKLLYSGSLAGARWEYAGNNSLITTLNGARFPAGRGSFPR